MEVFRVGRCGAGNCACNGRGLWHERSFDGSGLSAYFRERSHLIDAHGKARQGTQPCGTGPVRVSAIVPALPALLPAVQLNCKCADEQLANVIVATPMGSVTGARLAAWSKIPPVEVGAHRLRAL
jgi:hypothetical protein